jgi:hypothetical protein
MIVNPFCTAATVLTEACDFPSHENKHSWQKKSHPELYSQREEEGIQTETGCRAAITRKF